MLTILQGDSLETLRTLKAETVDCVVTSPPYWQLRNYGVEGQMGMEPTLGGYLARMTEVFREVRRVLKKKGTCWVNLGDLYAGGGNGGGGSFAKDGIRMAEPGSDKNRAGRSGARLASKGKRNAGRWNDGGAPVSATPFLKRKDLVGLPWRVAFALQEDGWWLRRDIVWHKPNAMPESVDDRPATSHEYVFLLTKSERYYFDAEAIKEPVSGGAHSRGSGINPKADIPAGWAVGAGSHAAIDHTERRAQGFGKNSRVRVTRTGRPAKQNRSFSAAVRGLVETRNARSVWTIACKGYREAHFATFPPKLVEPCILSGCPRGGVVLDPFAGSGTTGQVALELGRKAVLIELNPEYVRLIERRMSDAAAARMSAAA